MSGESSSPGAWWSGLEPAPADLISSSRYSDDPRLGDVVQRWDGGAPTLVRGQPVLIGFPCDEGISRNGGRPGAARAPDSVRQYLYRLTAWDGITRFDLSGLGLLDLGNVAVAGGLEQAQHRLGEVVTAALKAQAVPVVLGGGHETTFGHYLGYVGAALDAAIINVDAHLDVRPFPAGGHSGSPFRQAMEHPAWPLKPGRYSVISAQRQSVARAHVEYVEQRRGRIHWLPARAAADWVLRAVLGEFERLATRDCAILLSVDADAFHQGQVPGTSAPSPVGLEAEAWPEIALLAGARTAVRSIDLVEVNPALDRDGQTARWAALGIRQFLVGLGARGLHNKDAD